MAKTRMTRKRHYGTLPVRKNFLPLVPVVGLLGLVGAGWAGFKVYTATNSVVDTLTRPSVLIGTGIGLIAGMRASESWLERLAFMGVGLGAGMLVDSYLGEE
jgi:hypothetical protein